MSDLTDIDALSAEEQEGLLELKSVWDERGMNAYPVIRGVPRAESEYGITYDEYGHIELYYDEADVRMTANAMIDKMPHPDPGKFAIVMRRMPHVTIDTDDGIKRVKVRCRLHFIEREKLHGRSDDQTVAPGTVAQVPGSSFRSEDTSRPHPEGDALGQRDAAQAGAVCGERPEVGQEERRTGEKLVKLTPRETLDMEAYKQRLMEQIPDGVDGIACVWFTRNKDGSMTVNSGYRVRNVMDVYSLPHLAFHRFSDDIKENSK